MKWTNDLENEWAGEDDLEGSDPEDDAPVPDDYRIYPMENPPNIKCETENSRKAEVCIQRYFRTRNDRYLQGFLHYYEPTINRIVAGFLLRYAMSGHFADLKQEAALGILEAAERYDYSHKKSFQRYANRYIVNRLHDYTRRMRRGCTVETDYAYDKLRKIMALFYDLGGCNNAETIYRVATAMDMKLPDANGIIQAALLNMRCTEIYRDYSADDEESEDCREEITVSREPEPYEALMKQYRKEALLAAWNALNYREQQMLADRLAFCPDCFNVMERTGPSSFLIDCKVRDKQYYADIAVVHGLSSPETAQRICEAAIDKMRSVYTQTFQKKIICYYHQ